ncbi:hypothetical protein D3C80_1487330 [compost metagenome]
MKNSIDPEKAKQIIEKYQKQFGKPDRKVDNFDLPNSVRLSRKDIEEILKDDSVDGLLLYFAIGEVESDNIKRQFLNIVATGLSAKGTDDTTLKAAAEPSYAEGSCPCPTLKSCC